MLSTLPGTDELPVHRLMIGAADLQGNAARLLFSPTSRGGTGRLASMPDHDWIAVLARGDFALSLPVLKLVQAESPRFQGSGRLVWNQTSGVKIYAVTDGAEELRESIGQWGASVLIGLVGQSVGSRS